MRDHKTVIRASIAFIILGPWFGCSSALVEFSPHESVRGRPKEIKELHMRQAELIRAWYRDKSEKDFWNLISRHGPLDRIANRDLFLSAFTEPVDQVYPGDREMSAEPLRKEWENSYGERLNEGHPSFAIVRPPQYRTGDPLYVFYAIQGDGFATKAICITWKRENGTWMVWNIEELTVEPEEEATEIPLAVTGIPHTRPHRGGVSLFTTLRTARAEPSPRTLPLLFVLIHRSGVCKKAVCTTMTATSMEPAVMAGGTVSVPFQEGYARTERRGRHRHPTTQGILFALHALRWSVG